MSEGIQAMSGRQEQVEGRGPGEDSMAILFLYHKALYLLPTNHSHDMNTLPMRVRWCQGSVSTLKLLQTAAHERYIEEAVLELTIFYGTRFAMGSNLVYGPMSRSMHCRP